MEGPALAIWGESASQQRANFDQRRFLDMRLRPFAGLG